jgi:hypothetical protein
MATSRFEAEALAKGRNTAQWVAGGGFKVASPQTMGTNLRRLLSEVENRSVRFATPEITWSVVREMVRETLLERGLSERLYNVGVEAREGRRRGSHEEEFPVTVSIVFFGRTDPRSFDLSTTSPDQVAARMIGSFSPSFVDVIPERWREEALPPMARGPKIGPQHVEVNVPMEGIREEVKQLGRDLSEQLHTQVEGGLTAGFDRMTASIPVLIRGLVPAQPAAQPQPAPVQRGTLEFVGAPVEMPKTTGQRDLFGGRPPAPKAQGLVEAPSVLTQQLEDKYRPLYLDDVVGNGANVSVLRAAAGSGNFGKLYLVTGRPGIGKTSAVIASIRDYLRLHQGAIGQLFNPDYSTESITFGIDPSVLLYANALRLVTRGGGVATLLGDLARFTKTGGYPGIRRFAVVDDVTKFSKDNQQILLPLTEKYPRTTFFFLANDDDYIDALRSRARHLRWSTPEPEEVVARLVTIIDNERFPFPDAYAEAKRIVDSMGRSVEFRQAIVRLAADADALNLGGGA